MADMSNALKENESAREASLNCRQLSLNANPGMVSIKPEFIDYNYKPRLVADYLPESAVEEIQQIISSQGNIDKDDQTSDLPAKRRKLKGRNKKRPIEKRPSAAERLCPNIIGGRTCSFGERCKFSHDIAKFLESRPRSITGKCYVFEVYGKCPFGITCLFADQHRNSDSVVSETDHEMGKNALHHSTVRNIVSKDLQIKLRKKEYSFKRANKIIKQFQEKISYKGKRREKDQSTATVSGGDEHQCDMKTLGNVKSVDANECSDSHQQSGLSVCDGDLMADAVTCDEALGESDQVICSEYLSENLIQEGSLVDAELNSVLCSDIKPTCNDECLSQNMNGMETTVENSQPIAAVPKIGCVGDEDVIKLRNEEKKKIDFKDRLYLAPLTTVGNLPFRRICRRLGADVTCGEMVMPSNLLQGQASEWALLKRHESEKLFGVQLCASFPDSLTRAAQVIADKMEVDFVDVNLGCPIDLVVQRGEGCAVMGRIGRLEQIVYGMSAVIDVPLTVKMRTGLFEGKGIAHTLLPKVRDWGVSMATVHGRSREQRYTKLADWNYIRTCVDSARPLQIFGNGDILSYLDYNRAMNLSAADGCMIARGALIKPWIFTEIKEQRHWDISASERLEIVQEFVNYGLEHWGSDQQGVANTRRFLLEWLSFVYRYIPVGILEHVPQRINEKPPHYFGRNDLETLMASPNCADWIKISEMFLGPVPSGFTFLPKHRANAYQ